MQINTTIENTHSYFSNNSIDLDLLQKNLSAFGLDPYDWHLIEYKKDCFYIENKMDPEFKFIGKTHPKNTFENISLISL